MSEITCQDMRLIAEALTDQSRRLASRARGKALAGPGLAIARAELRERSERLAWLAMELAHHAHEPVIVRCEDSGRAEPVGDAAERGRAQARMRDWG